MPDKDIKGITCSENIRNQPKKIKTNFAKNMKKKKFSCRELFNSNEDCSKSFGIKTFLRNHRCLKYWESEKKFAKPLSRAFS